MTHGDGREPLEAPDRAPGATGRLLLHGTGAFVVAATLLSLQGALGFLDSLYLAGLLILFPVLAVAQLPLASADELETVPAYVGSMILITLLGLGSFVLGVRAVGLAELGLGPVPWLPVLRDSMGMTVGGLGLVLVFFVARRRLGVAESPLVARLLPQGGREKGLFALLSLIAGVGEELAFRGYAITLLQAVISVPWVSVVVSSVSFGFLHAYQGWIGIVRTTALGLLFATFFVEVGSLWPIMVAHTTIDLAAGFLLGERLVRS